MSKSLFNFVIGTLCLFFITFRVRESSDESSEASSEKEQSRIGSANAPPVTDGKVEIQSARAFTSSEPFSKSFSGYTFQGKIVYR